MSSTATGNVLQRISASAGDENAATIVAEDIGVEFPVATARARSIKNVALAKVHRIGGHVVDRGARVRIVLLEAIEVLGGGRRRDAGGDGQLPRAVAPAGEQRVEHRGARRVGDQRGDGGEVDVHGLEARTPTLRRHRTISGCICGYAAARVRPRPLRADHRRRRRSRSPRWRASRTTRASRRCWRSCSPRSPWPASRTSCRSPPSRSASASARRSPACCSRRSATCPSCSS